MERIDHETRSGGIFTGKGRLPTHRCLYVKVEDVDAITDKVKKQGSRSFRVPLICRAARAWLSFRTPKGT
jgi:predicted enzyme related to lactoylglutathione lyase